ncbi:MAG: hypothetical protein ACRDVL_03000 [Acidimicrobiia bacterium]
MGKQKISSQIRPELLAEVGQLAAAEGRQLHSVLDEALTEWVAKKRDEAPQIIGRARFSREQRRKLHEELAHWANLSRL